MKVLSALKSGLLKSIKAWKAVLIIWTCYLILVILIAIPLKNALNTEFGQSMITEKLRHGFFPDVFGDTGLLLRTTISWLSWGLILIMAFAILINSFLSGGLFYSLKRTAVKFSSAEFFKASARYFWSILVMTLIINIALPFLALFIVGIPISLIIRGGAASGSVPPLINAITLSIMLVILLTLLLAADYARAWQVTNEKPACFRALGFGFERTFRTYFSSFPMMLLLFTVQVLFIWFVLRILEPMLPGKGTGVFILFILSQLMFIARLMLKTLRYACVTALKEIDDPELNTQAPGTWITQK